jgi:hypothetical protein
MAKIPKTKRYYEPIPGETHKAWSAICVYRDRGYGRTLDNAWRQMTGKENGRHARHWAAWSVQNHWVSRCEAYDKNLLRKARLKIQEERIARYAEEYGQYW